MSTVKNLANLCIHLPTMGIKKKSGARMDKPLGSNRKDSTNLVANNSVFQLVYDSFAIRTSLYNLQELCIIRLTIKLIITLLKTRSIGQPTLTSIKSISALFCSNSAHLLIVSGKLPQS